MKQAAISKKIIVGAVFCFVGLTFAGIRGSKHDFSGETWNIEGEICLPCHVPHNAASQLEGPLWNHESTTATFTLYDSPSLIGAVEQPRTASMTCLSCHDGTVAVDSYGGRTGGTFIEEDALIGTDLSNDHPISIKWQHQISFVATHCGNCHSFEPLRVKSELPFFDGYMECSTCHDVHGNSDYTALLRKSPDGSDICFHCHAK